MKEQIKINLENNSFAILNKILSDSFDKIPLLKEHINKLKIYEREKGKWYIEGNDANNTEKIIFNSVTGKSNPEEIIRQLFILELIKNYNYQKEYIKIEQTVTFGIDESKRADIIVYLKDKITPYILIETKAPSEKINVQQLKSYLNAEGSPIGVGINGMERIILYRPYPKQFDDTLPDIPRFDEDIEDVFKRDWTIEKLEELDKKKNTNLSLRSIIETLEELVLANSGVESFNEIFKLIYAKLYDEVESKNREKHLLRFRKYKDPKNTYRIISDLFEEAKDLWTDVFDKSDKIKLTAEHLSVCVGALEGIKLFGANLRIIDEAFEYLVPEVSKSKKGQFFTPRIVIDSIVTMLNPSKKEYVIDPACGSAGFLVHTMNHVKNKYKLADVRSYASKYLWGIDFDEKSTKISRAIMLIAGDGKSHIYRENSIEYDKWSPKISSDLIEERIEEEGNNRDLKFNILMSNPPFAGEIQEKSILSKYSIVKEIKNSIGRHILFIERSLDLVRPGGRLALILPQGIFNNSGDQKIRKYIMKRARILGVVGLDVNTFKPHTGTKTSILLLRKWDSDQGNTLSQDYPIFFAVSNLPFKDSSGNYIVNKDNDGGYQTDLIDIASDFINWGQEQLKKGDNHFEFLGDL